jgi:hypothetical protein
MSDGLLHAAIGSLLTDMVSAQESTATDDSFSAELFAFLSATVQSSASEEAFNIFACYVPSERALADVWPAFWHSVKRFSVPASETDTHASAARKISDDDDVQDDGSDDCIDAEYSADDDAGGACALVASANLGQSLQISAASSVSIALLRLDHMRRPKPYSCLICRWAENLGISGFLLFCNHLILIFLVAKEPHDIARYMPCSPPVLVYIITLHPVRFCNISCRYLQLHRTQTVDVDSQGRPCREKMLTVLLQQQHHHQQQHQQQLPFRVLHASTLQDAIDIVTSQSAGAISRENLKSLGFKV